MNKLLSILLVAVFSTASFSAIAADPMTTAAVTEAPQPVKHHHHQHHAKKMMQAEKKG